MHNFTATYTDLYQINMAQVYFQQGKHNDTAVFDYFFRKLPYKGGYAIFAGLDTLLEILEDFKFSKEDLAFLKEQGLDAKFIGYLENFRFKGSIFSSAEGDMVFPSRPVLQVEANMVEAQLVETILLNILNFQTLIATKASRIRKSAGDQLLIDFGMRRAQSTGAYHASRAAFIGGFEATSNVVAGKDFNIPISGTMAHSFIQSYDDELTAFRDFAKSHPDNTILLIDTYDTLKSGLPNAITVGKEMKSRGEQLKGIRLDSGDLSYLAKKCRKALDEAGLTDVKIAASNQLDEYVIRSLKEQQGPIDVFGVGTNLVIGSPDAALDGVYKLAFAGGKPRIKLSENLAKLTLPHRKQVYRIRNHKGELAGADAVTLREETEVTHMNHPFDVSKSLSFQNCTAEALLQPVMENGKRLQPPKSLADIKTYSRKRLAEFSEEFQRFENPHLYKIGISDQLLEAREQLRTHYKNKNA
ncbi:nicotinate phosphoribosyltransferase [Psychroflexus montanilacus]|uniref:nicotinate phosphoribosyltransferase n=1 Tax=Psychroflexus montanilacus TaxID=2873598 RepID=UPI001CCEEA50|nr:nicotinate phosphoribosyltransferase [Psychroflexus montanilacus]MBZ9652283.1 nicotinate phosphoribosyltransferase [Psychroflexus montanilacus]